MTKKYELIPVGTGNRYRIKALKDIPRHNVKAGDLGGYVEGEWNLSHDGDCWVGGNAQVCDRASVKGEALVTNNAYLRDNATVTGYACVSGYSTVAEGALVCDFAKVEYSGYVLGCAYVGGRAIVRDHATIGGTVKVLDSVVVESCAICGGDAILTDNAYIGLNAFVRSGRISKLAQITTENDYFVCGPVGSRQDYITFYRTATGIYVKTGCFEGTIDEFKKAVRDRHGRNRHRVHYYSLCWIAEERILQKGREV